MTVAPPNRSAIVLPGQALTLSAPARIVRFLFFIPYSIYNAFLVGKKTLKIAPSPWDCVTPPEEDGDRQQSNMHENFCKDRACDSGDMLENRQRDTHRHSTHRRADYNTSPPLLRAK